MLLSVHDPCFLAVVYVPPTDEGEPVCAREALLKTASLMTVSNSSFLRVGGNCEEKNKHKRNGEEKSDRRLGGKGSPLKGLLKAPAEIPVYMRI